ncbi:MAG: hypothetical protein IJ042_09910 [Butyricicoccus sp.]|nr:hypothetical protein [Butyricicoccus sp.]
MWDWKAVCKKVFVLPGWLLMLLTVISTVGLVAVFVKGWDSSAVAYIVYVLSFYTLTVDCVFFSGTLPGYYRQAKQKVYGTSLGNRYMTDTAFKVRVSLYNSLAISLLYSAFKLIAGVYYSSVWWGAVAFYYMVLALIRFLLLRYMNSNQSRADLLSEYRRYRLCGILMVLLNLALSGIVFQMVWQNRAYTYPEIILIAIATYTFYTVTVSIIDLVKYRKFKSPVMSASKAIRFAAALVSLLNLETAMLARYSDDEAFRRLMTALTGTGVCLIVLVISVIMVVRANREIRALQGK